MLPLLLALGAVGAPPPAAPPPTSPDERASAAPPSAPSPPRPRDDDDDDDAEGKVAPGSPLVVTGRRLDAARTGIDAALGATLYALSNDAIENRPGGETGRIAQILAQAPGVAVQGDAIAIRGTRAVQLRINDVIVPEAVRDPQERLGTRLAETTRLLTGTLPAQFGFAPGGVVSVTTKSGLYAHGGQAELFAGNRGFVEPAAEWSGSVGGASLFASGSLERGRAILAAADGAEGRDTRREAGALAFADLLLGPHDRVSLLLGGSDERHRIDGTGLGPGVEHGSAGYAVGTFQHSDDGLSLQASLFAAVATDRVRFRTAGRERRRSFGTQIDATQSLGARNTLRAGLLASHAGESETDPLLPGSHAGRTPLALYVQDEWKIAPALTFNPGVRAEWLRGPARQAKLEPRASLVWAAGDDVTAHAGYSRYAAAPPLRAARAADLPDEADDYYDVGAQRRTGPLHARRRPLLACRAGPARRA